MKKLLLSLAFASMALMGGFVHAQTQAPFCQGGSCTYTVLEPIPGLPDCYGPNPPKTCTNPTAGGFQNLIGNSFKFLIGAGAAIAVVMLIIGALTYMFSDVLHNKTKALSRIRNAMWALVLLISSFLILNTINPDLVNFKLNLSAGTNPGGVNTPVTTGTTQLTPAQIQAQQNSCTQACGSIGGALKANADGSYTCQCTTGTSPI